MRLEFATAGRILFGEGVLRDVPAAAAAMGRRALLVTGASGLRTPLNIPGVDFLPFAVAGEPTLDLIRSGAAYARGERCDLVIAIGGGSVLDAGKALAALLTNPGDPMDYLEMIGRGQPLANPSAPCIAIPTTAGTGSEVTRNVVVGSPLHRVKPACAAGCCTPGGGGPRTLLWTAAPSHRRCGLDARRIDPTLRRGAPTS
jgi:alcohol dehydrogenase class IV